MKTNYKHFPRYWLVLFLVMALATVIGACSSTAASTTTPTPRPTPKLSSITVTTPVSLANLAVGSTQQFIDIGSYTDGAEVNITSQVTWETSAATIATISSTGLATGVAAGNTNITASMSGVTSLAITLTVVSP